MAVLWAVLSVVILAVLMVAEWVVLKVAWRAGLMVAPWVGSWVVLLVALLADS